MFHLGLATAKTKYAEHNGSKTSLEFAKDTSKRVAVRTKVGTLREFKKYIKVLCNSSAGVALNSLWQHEKRKSFRNEVGQNVNADQGYWIRPTSGRADRIPDTISLSVNVHHDAQCMFSIPHPPSDPHNKNSDCHRSRSVSGSDVLCISFNIFTFYNLLRHLLSLPSIRKLHCALCELVAHFWDSL